MTRGRDPLSTMLISQSRARVVYESRRQRKAVASAIASAGIKAAKQRKHGDARVLFALADLVHEGKATF